MSSHHLTSMLPLLAALVLAGQLALPATLNAEDPPFPVPLPNNWQEFLGDPDRGPEPHKKYAKSHQYVGAEVTWPVNQGNPYTDWGHFRMRKEASGSGRLGKGLRAPIKDRDRELIAELHGRFETKDWEDGSLLRYSVMIPDPQESPMPKGGYPLVVTSPGSGGVGDEGLLNWRLNGGAIWATDYYRKNMPAVVLILHPQSRSVSYTGDSAKGEFGDLQLNPTFEQYVAVIDHFANADGINKKRISVYGHSMGGSSTWALVRARPHLFAAAVPLAGSPFSEDPTDYALLKGTPMWIMMGNNDPWNGSHKYNTAYRNLLAAGHQQVRYWEFQDIGHSGSPLGLYHVHQWMWHQVRE